MTNFVRHGKAEHRRAVGACLCRQPFDTVHEDRRQLSLAGARVYQGVSELKLPRSRRRARKPDKSNGEFRRLERRATGRRGVHTAVHPGDVDAGGGQDPGRCTQSNRLIRRRHHPGVVHAHLDMMRKRRSVFRGRLYDT